MIRVAIERYDTYKESGIRWFGEIPKHWQMTRNKNLFRESKNRVGSRSKEFKVLSLTVNGVIERDMENNKGKFPSTFDGYQIIEPGSILLCLFDMDVTPRIVGYVDKTGLVTSAYTNIRPIYAIFPKYYYYYFLNQDMNKSLLANGKGLRSTLRFDNFGFLSLPLPPLPEQKAIADYLDAKTAQIDRQIDLLSQKAEKYAQLKQSLISETVTRGLDKSAPMKESGIEWIGEIPAHWEVKRVNDIAVQQKNRNIGLLEKNLLSLSYGKIIRKDFDTTFGLLPASFETYQIVKEGNIILRLTDLQNDQRSLRVGLVKEQGIITSAYLCLRFSKAVFPVFGYYLLHAHDISKVFYWFGGGLRQSMKFDDIKVFPFALPPLPEQKAIAEYLDAKTAHIERIIETIQTQIEKLQELRKVLINDVVTGKIKVVQV